MNAMYLTTRRSTASMLPGKTILVTGRRQAHWPGHRAAPGARKARASRSITTAPRTKRGAPPRNAAAPSSSAPTWNRVPEIQRMFGEVEQRLGRLDGLVNNAARFTRFDPLDITEKDWDFIHRVNLKAVFFCCQQAALLMQRQGGGRIVNISSLGGIRRGPNMRIIARPRPA